MGRGFWAVLVVLLSLQIAPGTMNNVVIIGVAGFFVVVILIMAGALVVSSCHQAKALVRISEGALESQVRTAATSRVSRDRFLERGGLVLEKGGRYYLVVPGYRRPVPVEVIGLSEEEVDYMIEKQHS
ncbi:MAG TPA: hypothetical protein VH186_20600 [Chloroflexia bacterium]|nr:hypothetical protein [Chloroflexia bacterium]